MTGLMEKIASLEQKVDELWDRSEISRVNERFTPVGKNPFMRIAMKLENFAARPTPGKLIHAPQRAIVTNTLDPLCKHRVQIYCPKIHANAQASTLPWAEVASFFGSLEDQGSSFTPPAGSTVLVSFEDGDRESPIVIGSIYNASRGDGGYQIIEERTLWGGTPGQRADAKNPNTSRDPNYLMPPWNNESYDRPDGYTAGANAPTPHIYGIKTPQKHFIQFHDGNPKKELKGKRLVIQSSKGSTIFMKDDVLQSPSEIFENPMWDDFKDAYPGLMYSARPYNQHTIELKQSGVQIQSVGGGRLIISDETERDQFSNAWSAGWSPQGRMRSFVCLESITGHQIIARDSERIEGHRSRTDGVFLVSASGNFVGLRDDTIGQIGGFERGILLWSTSNHRIELNDYTVENASPRSPSGGLRWRRGRPGRAEIPLAPGNHTPNAKRAYIRIRSGFGQIMELNDLGSQEDNARQYILIRNENKRPNSRCPGPPWNYIRMECVTGDKFFHIWGAGTFLLSVCNNATRLVHRGSDFVNVRKGSHIMTVEEGSIFARAYRGITHWTETGAISLLVGRIVKRRLEFEPYPVIIAKDPYVCPFTSRLHFDTPSRHVFASR